MQFIIDKKGKVLASYEGDGEISSFNGETIIADIFNDEREKLMRGYEAYYDKKKKSFSFIKPQSLIGREKENKRIQDLKDKLKNDTISDKELKELLLNTICQ